MSEKRSCPVCDSYTSSVARAMADGEPCPYCEASPDLMRQVEEAERRGADAQLLEKYKAKCVELTKARAELVRLKGLVASARQVLDQVDA